MTRARAATPVNRGSGPEVAAFVGQLPGCAGVVGAEQPAVLVFDDCVDPAGIGAEREWTAGGKRSKRSR